MNNADMKQIIRLVKDGLNVPLKIVGPDIRHVDHSTQVMADHDLAGLLDIIGSHNAALDDGATAAAWARLQTTVNKPVWATEDPREWSVLSPAGGQEIGTKAIVDPTSRVSGLVIYLAFPHAVDSAGSLTVKGQAIADGIAAAQRPAPVSSPSLTPLAPASAPAALANPPPPP
jgi:hypothetical protein